MVKFSTQAMRLPYETCGVSHENQEPGGAMVWATAEEPAECVVSMRALGRSVIRRLFFVRLGTQTRHLRYSKDAEPVRSVETARGSAA